MKERRGNLSGLEGAAGSKQVWRVKGRKAVRVVWEEERERRDRPRGERGGKRERERLS